MSELTNRTPVTVTPKEALIITHNILDKINIPISILSQLTSNQIIQIKQEIIDPIEVAKENLLKCIELFKDRPKVEESEEQPPEIINEPQAEEEDENHEETD